MKTSKNAGHAKNVDNLNKFNQFITGMDLTYDPANPAISAASLTSLYNNASAAQATFDKAFTDWKDATNNREIVFKGLRKFCSRVLAALEGSGAPQPVCKDTKALVDAIASGSKLTKVDAGKSSGTPPTGGGTPPTPTDPATEVHIIHVSFDEKVNLFGKIVLTLEGQPLYKPNEAELTVAQLKVKLAKLKTANEAAVAAEISLENARTNRNTLFYHEGTGLLDLVRQAKAYIKSLQGGGSQLYKSVAGIRFKRVVPRKNAN